MAGDGRLREAMMDPLTSDCSAQAELGLGVARMCPGQRPAVGVQETCAEAVAWEALAAAGRRIRPWQWWCASAFASAAAGQQVVRHYPSLQIDRVPGRS